ncbi:hypothetical protein ACCS55_20855, partial [Rhizobium ruizarguesonis]
PFVALRNRKKGYAVSIIKAGLRVLGHASRQEPGKLSQTIQLDEEAAGELFQILRREFGFK